MKKNIVISIILLFLYSCSSVPDGYKNFKNNIVYKLHIIGETEQTAKVSDYITISFAYSTMQDSVFFLNNKKIQITQPNYPGSIDECFTFMNLGDSITFLLSPLKFFSNTLKTEVPSFLENEDYFKFSVKLEHIQTYKEFEAQKKQFLSWISDFGEYEKVFLQQFLENNNIGVAPSKSGLYKLTTEEGSGRKPVKGDTVSIKYAGKFLNGVFFDSSEQEKMYFEFIYGKEWQVIKGVEEALATMREGETAIVILPSKLAFGHKGSSSGIIPPYTSVIYELSLNKIAKGDTTLNNAIIVDNL